MKPKIAYIVHTLNPGGTERLALEMARAFSDAYHICILCLDEPGQWAGDARRDNIPVHCLYRQPGIDLTLPVKLAGFAKKHRIGLFHAHQCTPWFYAGLSRLLYPGVKLLVEEHGRHYPEIRNAKRIWFNRLFLRHLTTAATAVSADIKDRLVLYEGLRRDQISVIYNGAGAVDPYTAEERDRLRKSFGFAPGEPVMGTVGRLDPIKNLPLFLDGFQQAKQSCPGLKALIVGDGPLMPELEHRIRSQGLTRDVVLAGFRTDSARLVQVMDIFCLVSFSEGTSMALLESMAAGIPAIVTRVGGNPEIVIHGQTGWVIPSDDGRAFAAALREAVLDTGNRSTLGRRAKRRFEKAFSFKAMIENYDHLYRRILAYSSPCAA